MNPAFAFRHVFPVLFGIGLIAGAAGCSLQQSDDFRTITVENEMDEPLVFFAYDNFRVDPLSEVPMDEFVSRDTSEEGGFYLDSGEKTTLQKADISYDYNPEKPLHLSLYEVRNDTAYSRGSRRYSYDELSQRDFHIVISGFSKE